MSCDPEPLRLAQRVAAIEPFWVMECAKTADRIARSPACDPARGGTPMIYLNIGEPDFTAPLRVQAAAQSAASKPVAPSTPRPPVTRRCVKRLPAGTAAGGTCRWTRHASW
jgi:aspartate/methionine/tyrosine aminotransferase